MVRVDTCRYRKVSHFNWVNFILGSYLQPPKKKQKRRREAQTRDRKKIVRAGNTKKEDWIMSAINQIKIDEGFRGRPYKDTVGKITIGYGRNLDDNPLTEEEAEYLLHNDLKKVIKEVVQLRYYAELNPIRRSVVINMVYNLGMPRFKSFVRMNGALTSRNYDLAASEMLDSKWAKQVGDRAVRLADKMSRGV